jgi:hypothetical protein
MAWDLKFVVSTEFNVVGSVSAIFSVSGLHV